MKRPQVDPRGTILRKIAAERSAAIAHVCQEFPEEGAFVRAAEELIDKVLFVVGSPRGGTSAVKEALRWFGNFQAMPGEHRFPFTLLGLNYPFHGEDAECRKGGLSPDEAAFVRKNVFFECGGVPSALETKREAEIFAWKTALRLRLQYPQFDLGLDELVAWVLDGISDFIGASVAASQNQLPATLLNRLIDRGAPFDLRDYDGMGTSGVGTSAVDWSPSGGGSPIIEISPFVRPCPSRRRSVGPGQGLLLKASSDAHRLSAVDSLFPGRHVSYLHLTRNPAAAVNGLLDGWEHSCFWQHEFLESRRRWCFDLVEGFREHEWDLVSISVRQWARPHQNILQASSGREDFLRLKFEDFQVKGDRREAFLRRALGFCQVDPYPDATPIERPPAVVNQTSPPGMFRWRRARPWLLDRLREREVEDLCSRLDYSSEEADQWT